jgi:putative ABC transport system substrate-binding protein
MRARGSRDRALAERRKASDVREEFTMLRRQALARTLLLLTGAPSAWAQPPRKLARVGWLTTARGASPGTSVPLDAFRAGLAELGWSEGVNLVLEVREGEREQAPSLVAELLRAHVQVIAAMGPMAFAARAHTGSTPLVFAINGDPVEAGLVASMARPGGSLTGLSAQSIELSGKRVELLKAAQPAATRLAALANDRHPGRRIEYEATLAAAQRLGFTLKYYPVVTLRDFDAAFAAIAADGATALVSFTDGLVTSQAAAIAEFSRRQRLPSISGWAEFAQAGNLMSYGPSYREFYRRSASYVDRLLRGAQAAELPVEQPTRFELVLNRTTAHSIGVKLQPSLLTRADEVLG